MVALLKAKQKEQLDNGQEVCNCSKGVSLDEVKVRLQVNEESFWWL
jgi:hypothetical protein